jgi:hypothetical protein
MKRNLLTPCSTKVGSILPADTSSSGSGFGTCKGIIECGTERRGDAESVVERHGQPEWHEQMASGCGFGCGASSSRGGLLATTVISQLVENTSDLGGNIDAIPCALGPVERSAMVQRALHRGDSWRTNRPHGTRLLPALRHRQQFVSGVEC